MSAAISSITSSPALHPLKSTDQNNSGGSSFANLLGQHIENVANQGSRIETNIQEAVMGKGGLEHIVQDFAEFTTQVEAMKNLTDAAISAVKQIVNTPI